MSLETDILSVLSADSALSALLSGGFYAYEATDRNGISRATTPSAYVSGFLRPLTMVRDVGETLFSTVRDVQSGARSVRRMIYVFLYDNIVFTTIDSAATMVIALLNGKLVGSHGRCEYLRLFRQRDPLLNNAAMIRIDFVLTSVRGDNP